MSPRIQAIPPVARQCCPKSCEYSKRTNDPPARTAVSIARLRFASMVNPARPTNDFANPRSGANCKRRSCVARHHAARVAADERPLLHLPFELDHVQRVLFRSRSRRSEVRGFAFDREPGQRNSRIASVQPQIRIRRASTHRLRQTDLNAASNDGRF